MIRNVQTWLNYNKNNNNKTKTQKNKKQKHAHTRLFLYPSVIESFSCFVYAHIARIHKTKQKNKEEKKQA